MAALACLLRWARTAGRRTRAPAGPTPSRDCASLGSAWRLATVALSVVAVSGRFGATAAPEPVATALPTGAIRASVRLLDGRGRSTPGADAVLWLPGLRGGDPGEIARRPTLTQRQKQFVPHVQVVRVGGDVAFPNLDRIYHNVFSLSEIARFDLGLYRNGASRSVTFAKPGIVRVYCNIHPQMTAFLVVVDSDFYAKTDARGEALLTGVPAGRWRLSAWHERADESEHTVTVSAGGTSDLRLVLDASAWRFVPHKNKYGQDYPPPDDDEDRY